jgi:outer membrane protein
MRLYLSVLLVTLFTANIFAQRTLTLDEAISIALQRNTSLQKNINSYSSSDASIKAAMGNLLPSVSAGAGWQWSRSESDKEQTYTLQGQMFKSSGVTQDSRQISISANAQWTLFDGLASWRQYDNAKLSKESLRLELERLKQTTTFNIVSEFYAVLNTVSLQKMREDDLAWNKKNLETIEEKNKLGSVTLADVYSQQVKVGTAELALITVQNDVATAKNELLNTLGLNVLEDVTLVDPLENSNSKIDDAKSMVKEYGDIYQLVKTALEKRYDYQSAQLGIKSAENDLKIANSGYMPSLSNNYSVNMGANNLSDLTKTRSYSVGLSLNVPIFSGWSTDKNVQAAQVSIKNKNIELEEKEKEIKINLKKAYLDLQAAQKRLDVSESNVLAAEKNRQIEQEKYNIGSGTLLNLMIANSDYTTAKQTSINNKFDFVKYKAAVEYYLGILK